MRPARRIPPKMKRALVLEAGEKCANPGCTSWRTHIHHIRHWHVYRTHDQAHMIAVCPSCHDAIHHGRIPIDDLTLYRWKGVSVPTKDRIAMLASLPAEAPMILCGTLFFASANERQMIFKPSEYCKMELRVLAGDVIQLNAILATRSGTRVLSVTENVVRIKRDPAIEVAFEAGHLVVRAPANEEYIPGWAVEQVREEVPKYASDGMITALEVDFFEPGVLRVQGVWPGEKGTVVATAEALHFCQPPPGHRLTVSGEDPSVGRSVLTFTGPASWPFFAFEPGVS